MPRRRASWVAHQAIPADELARQRYGERRHRDPADATVMPEVSAEDEWAEAFGDALLFGVALVMLGAATPFVLLVLAWLGWAR